MANFNIQGKLLKKYEIEWDNLSIPSREFIVETVDDNFPQFIKFQLTQNHCDFLDIFEEGEFIKVSFELQGMEQKGTYKTILHALKIEKTVPRQYGIFKYQIEFDKLGLQNCPPDEYQGLQIVSFRFIYKDLSDKNSFSPALLKNPVRMNAKSDSGKCLGLGLSLFQDEQEAKKHFRYWIQKKGIKFAEDVGDHLAMIEIEIEDGVGSEPNAHNTHFTFHEYAHTDLTKKISRVEKI